MGPNNARMKKIIPDDVIKTEPRPRSRKKVDSRPTNGSSSTAVYLIGSSIKGGPSGERF